MAEIVPKTARNWRKERFRKYMSPFPYSVNPEPIGKAISTQRRRERRDKRREDKTSWRPGTESASPAYSSLRFLCVLCVSALSGLLTHMLSSRDASHADQVAEDDAFQGLRGGDAGITAAAAHRHGLQSGAVLVEGERVLPARVIVEIQFQGGAGLGVAQFQLTGPWRHAVFIRPQLQKHELVAVIGEILQRSLAALVIQEIRDDDDQPALRIRADEFPDRRQVIRGARRLKCGNAVHHSKEAVPATGGHHALHQAAGEALDLDG